MPLSSAVYHYTVRRSTISRAAISRCGRPGIGTSAVYICLGFLGEHALAIDERYEAMIDAPSEGIVTVSGATEPAKKIRAVIEGDDSSPLGEAGGGTTGPCWPAPTTSKSACTAGGNRTP